MASLDLPVTVLRPMVFMELMTDKGFYPPVAMWHVMPRLMGDDRPVRANGPDDDVPLAADGRVGCRSGRHAGVLPTASTVEDWLVPYRAAS